MPKGALPSLGRGVNAFFCVASCWQGVEIREGWLKLHSFQCIRGGCVLAAMSCWTPGPGDVPKGTSPGLGRGVNAFFCIVSCWQGVKIHKGWLKMPIPNALWAAHCTHFSILYLDCSVWENALHGCKSVPMQCSACLHGWDAGLGDMP